MSIDTCVCLVMLPGLNHNLVRNIGTLQDVSKNWKAMAVRPTLAVRVLCKARIHNYSKPNKMTKWPFQVAMYYMPC